MRGIDLSLVKSNMMMKKYRRTKYGLCDVNCYQNHNLMSSLSLMPLYVQAMVNDTIHWPRQNYEKDGVSNVRGLFCGCGRKWQVDTDKKKAVTQFK